MHNILKISKLLLSLGLFTILSISLLSHYFSDNFQISALNSSKLITPHNAMLPNASDNSILPNKNKTSTSNILSSSPSPSSSSSSTSSPTLTHSTSSPSIPVVHKNTNKIANATDHSPSIPVIHKSVNDIANTTAQTELKSMDVGIDKVGKGSSQTITVTVKDAVSGSPIDHASITGTINTESFSGFTDTDGTYSKKISSDVLDSGNSISVSVTVTADSYKTKKTETDFDNSSPTILDNNAIDTAKPSDNNKDNTEKNKKDLSSSIFDSVRKQLGDQGINIPLPFDQ